VEAAAPKTPPGLCRLALPDAHRGDRRLRGGAPDARPDGGDPIRRRRGVALRLAAARAGGGSGGRPRAGAGGDRPGAGRHRVVAASGQIEPIYAGGLGPLGPGAAADTAPAPAPAASLRPERPGRVEDVRHPGPVSGHGHRPGPVRPAPGDPPLRPGARTLPPRVPGTRSDRAAGGPGMRGGLSAPPGGPGPTGVPERDLPGPADHRRFAAGAAAGRPPSPPARSAGPGRPASCGPSPRSRACSSPRGRS
jgi:hypothetical protein